MKAKGAVRSRIAYGPLRGFQKILCQTGNAAVLDVNAKSCGSLGQAGHAHDGTGRHDDKTSTGVENQTLHGQIETTGGAEPLRVVRQGEGRLGNTHGQTGEAEAFNQLEVFLGGF